MTGAVPDPYSADRVTAADAPELLRLFNAAGVLAPADLHLAWRLAALAGEPDEMVGLAVALAGRAPRVGHVSVDLATVQASAVVGEDETDLESLPWPEPAEWLRRVRASSLVAAAPVRAGVDTAGVPGGGEPEGGPPCRPLRMAGTQLYLDRYWVDETEVAADLVVRARSGRTAPAPAWMEPRLEALFPGDGAADQRAAAATALTGRLTVIAGGPGTGKTTTVARLLALLVDHAGTEGLRPPLIGLAAPTGKAAARMEEALRAGAALLPVPAPVRRHLEAVSGVTLHRLLGSRPDSSSRFRHHRGHRLPHDVVVVDEASMVSLALMARLLEAVRHDARLIIVGDPEQLVSVEAGAVLADVVGPSGRPARAAAPAGSPAVPPADLGSRIAFLRTNHRFGGPLADLATAIRSGDADRVLEVLATGGPSVRWLPADAGGPAQQPDRRGPLEEEVAAWAAGMVSAAAAGDGPSALRALSDHRLLCAHRDGPAGVTAWNERVERWVAAELPDVVAGWGWYAGRPVMVTANDYSLRLFNGDTGVVVSAGDRLMVAFAGASNDGGSSDGGRGDGGSGDGGSRLRRVSPYLLPAVETVFATTVHKSQGSEFDRVTLVLPPETSRLLTRELFYTAVTRAREGVLVVGDEASVRRAVDRPLGRASGLAARLWGSQAPGTGR